MPQPRKALPNPAPGYIYKGTMETFVVLKVFTKGARKYVKAYAARSMRTTTIRMDAFMTEYGLNRCTLP